MPGKAGAGWWKLSTSRGKAAAQITHQPFDLLLLNRFRVETTELFRHTGAAMETTEVTTRFNLKHVLVVDDDELVRTLTKELFERIGCTVSVAENGHVALADIAARRPDLIVLDIIMPEKEGIETLVQVKRQYPEVKVIAISGGGRKQIDDLLIIADRLGADAVLKKPIKPTILLDHAAQLLWGRKVSFQASRNTK